MNIYPNIKNAHRCFLNTDGAYCICHSFPRFYANRNDSFELSFTPQAYVRLNDFGYRSWDTRRTEMLERIVEMHWCIHVTFNAIGEFGVSRIPCHHIFLSWNVSSLFTNELRRHFIYCSQYMERTQAMFVKYMPYKCVCTLKRRSYRCFFTLIVSFTVCCLAQLQSIKYFVRFYFNDDLNRVRLRIWIQKKTKKNNLSFFRFILHFLHIYF